MGHRRINDLVTEVDERTSEHRRVNDLRQLDRATRDPFQLLHHFRTLNVGQCPSSRHNRTLAISHLSGNVQVAVDLLLESTIGCHHGSASQRKSVLTHAVSNQRRQQLLAIRH